MRMVWRVLPPLLVLFAVLFFRGREPDPDPAEVDCAPHCWAVQVIDNHGNGADGVTLADFNGDGFTDVISGWEQSGELLLYLNPGATAVSAGPWPRVDVAAGLSMKGIEDAAFADLDGDGQADSILSSVEGRVQSIAIHRANGSPLLTSSWTAQRLAPTYRSRYMKARSGQIDGTGGPDIVAGSRNAWGDAAAVYWFRAPDSVDTDWQRQRIGDIDYKTTGLQLVDVDGDAWLDVLVAGRGEVGWYRNPQSQHERSWSYYRIATDVSEFALCDVDEDGVWDIVAGASRHSGLVARWFRRADATGEHWSDHPISAVGGRPGDAMGVKFVIKGVACADLDQDGRIDLVFTASGSGHGVFILTAPGADSEPWPIRNLVPYQKGMKYDNVELDDIDRDGDLDIVTSEEGEGVLTSGEGVVWLQNPVQ